MEKHYSSILSYYASAPLGVSGIIPLSTHHLDRPPPAKTAYKTQVNVINADTLDTALEYATAGHKTLLLNMANPDIPGGAPQLVGAQEEDLFRRTNLHKYLTVKQYPLHRKLLLSRGVEVIRDGLRKGYVPLPVPTHMDIISGSAPRHMGGGTRLHATDAQTMYHKMCALFHVAAAEGYTHLVLSAWGCGGFGCPPEHVARLFKQALALYADYFHTVTFAIWDENYPKSNYAIFNKILVGS